MKVDLDSLVRARWQQTRWAQPSDNAALLQLLRDVPMQAGLALATQRDPNFFALYRAQRGSHDVLFYDADGFAAMGAFLTRTGYVDGAAGTVGYVGDLRSRGVGRRQRAAFPGVYARALAEVSARTGCRAYLTAILKDNAMAMASLTKPRAQKRALPRYHHLTSYVMASLPMLFAPRTRTVPGITVRTATVDDVAQVAAFLHNDHRARPFGYRFDDGELEHRLAHWPGFSLDATFVAVRDNTIVGVCTAWDPSELKRYAVVRYGGAARWQRAAVRLASALWDCPALPDVGASFRTLYLTNLSIVDDDPAVLRALLFAVLPLAWRARAHMVALPLWGEHDALAAALRGFIVQRLAFELFVVTAADDVRTQWPSGKPGFELALA